MGTMTESWPMAELNEVRRLRVLAAATPAAAYAEGVVDGPFDNVWQAASDLEHTFPMLLADVRSMHVTHTNGEHLQAIARGRLGQRARFDVVMRPGWCWMQSRFLVGGMAAVPEGDKTRFAFMGAPRIPGARLLTPLIRRTHLGAKVIHRLQTQVHP
jgi:hypothetical protein